MLSKSDAGWSSLVARRAHNPKVVGSNPAPATNYRLVASLVVRDICSHYMLRHRLNIQGPA